MVDFDQLRALLNLAREHDLAEFEIEQDGLHLKIRKNAGAAAPAANVPAPAPGPQSTEGAALAALQAAAMTSKVAAPDDEMELAVVKSPIVGTFYRSPEPGAPPFVDVGSTVKKGQVLCIIEAMKLMNEIDSEYAGEIVAIYVENGQAVQYGERLFAIKTK